MKTTNLSLQILKPVVAATVAIVIICGLSVQPARANYIVTLEQVGSNVVATGSGAFDLSGLTFLNQGLGSPYMAASQGLIQTGSAASTDVYTGFTGPTSFGSGGNVFASTSSGDFVTIVGSSTPKMMMVPQGYVSGHSLSDSMTFNNATFASLGVTPGTYVWSWGTGTNQNFTLVIPAARVPDSGSPLGLFFLSLVGLFGLNRLRHVQLA